MDEDLEVKKLIKEELLARESKVQTPNAEPTKKRKRKCFEDQSQARILNTDSRLTNLYTHQLNQKNKKKDKEKTQPQLKKGIKRNSISSESSNTYTELAGQVEEYEERSRGFTSSLKSFLSGVDNINSCFQDETKDLSIHVVYLTIGQLSDAMV